MGSIWNVESLKVLHDERIKHLAEKTELQFKLNQLAIDKAEAMMRSKIEGMNEWRLQNKDERSGLATKEEISHIKNLVYMGVGIMLAVQFMVMLYVNLK
jgi:hypothetical protein